MASQASRRRLDLDERRALLLEVGLELFGRRPYDTISVDEIADTAGISKGLLYHYFPSKRDFYIAIIEVSARELLRVSQPRGLGGSALERLSESVDGYLEYVQSHNTGFMTLMRGGIGSDSAVREIIDSVRKRMADAVQAAFRPEGFESGILSAAIWGWIGFVETASVVWLERAELTRGELHGLLIGALVGALEAADREDPRLDLRQQLKNISVEAVPLGR